MLTYTVTSPWNHSNKAYTKIVRLLIFPVILSRSTPLNECNILFFDFLLKLLQWNRDITIGWLGAGMSIHGVENTFLCVKKFFA